MLVVGKPSATTSHPSRLVEAATGWNGSDLCLDKQSKESGGFLAPGFTTVAGEQNAFAAPRLGGVLGMHGLPHAWSLGLWLRCSGLRSRAGFAGPA